MLTSTFALTAISMEQQYVQCVLSSFEQNLQRMKHASVAGVASESMGGACQKLLAVADYLRCRKIETYVIPALHQSTTTLDGTLAELATLSAEADQVLLGIVAKVAKMEECGFDAAELFAQMGRYCECLVERIAIEDTRLLPSARDLLSPDGWFSIGAACLSDDPRHDERAPANKALIRNQEASRQTVYEGTLSNTILLHEPMRLGAQNAAPACPVIFMRTAGPDLLSAIQYGN